MHMDDGLQTKYRQMVEAIRQMQRVIVAFSAGVDSTVVLKVALDTLGPANVLALTGVSPSLASRELQSVKDLAEALSAPLQLIDTDEMSDPRYAANNPDRCYFCKSDLFNRCNRIAAEKGFKVVLNGVNADDAGDWRPGLQAARELAVRAPLLEAGMSKADVRALAKHLNLPNWEKPALACLASRIPYGTPVTITSLSQVEQAEAFLDERGFRNFRVRHHQKLARIEVSPADLHRLLEEPLRSDLIAHLKKIGYVYVTVDLQGFRSGSGNEVLQNVVGTAPSR